MPLNQETEIFLEQVAQSGQPPLNEQQPETARKINAVFVAASHPPEPVAQVEPRTIPGPGGEIPLWIYTPFGAGPFPLLVYFHGGGWVVGDLPMVDSICRTLANAAGCVVVSVDYRLAPEHKFPAGLEDAYTATKWVAENAALLNGDRRLIAVAGESAGGNLAAGVTLMARDRGEFALIYQLLIYPATQYQSHTASFHQYGENYFLTADSINWFWHHYLPSPTEGKNPYASPLLAENLANLPPGLIVTAEFDPLRDEGEIYGDRLREAGVEIKTIRYDGTIHGFINFAKFLPLGQTALKEIGAILQTAFARGKNQSESLIKNIGK